MCGRRPGNGQSGYHQEDGVKQNVIVKDQAGDAQRETVYCVPESAIGEKRLNDP